MIARATRAKSPTTIKIPYDMTDDELGEYSVSEMSKVKDQFWKFNTDTPGARKPRIDWSGELSDGTHFNDPQHSRRRRWAQRLVITLLTSPLSGNPPSGTSLSILQREILVLVAWMSTREIHEIHELSPEIIEIYIDELPRHLGIDPEDEDVGESRYVVALTCLIRLWEQSTALKRFGIIPMPAHPFSGRGSVTVARAIAKKVRGWIMPLPDEVAIPLLNKCAWMLGQPFNDILRLTKKISDTATETNLSCGNVPGREYHDGSSGDAQRLRETNLFLDGFEFACLEGEFLPWHAPLENSQPNNYPEAFSRLHECSRLWVAARNAASILVLSVSGMRISEFLGIKHGIDSETGLPQGVRLERSITGLYEWFVIRTILSKGKNGFPREVDWVLGMRPIGSSEFPLAVHALRCLNFLHLPWRPSALTDRLVLNRGVGPYIAKKTTRHTAIETRSFTRSLKQFVSEWVDFSQLPDKSKRRPDLSELIEWRERKGELFVCTALRKTWANFTLRCDSRLLPVIQMQFHHSNLATTEGGYIGNNPILQEALDSVATQKRNSMIYDLVFGESNVGGRMGKKLVEMVRPLRGKAKKLPKSERWNFVKGLCDEGGLQFFFAPFATCNPLQASKMRCHNESETPIWIRKTPNVETREPGLCIGCACAILDKSHEAFWQSRFLEYSLATKDSEGFSGDKREQFRAITFRADQARQVLSVIGAKLEND